MLQNIFEMKHRRNTKIVVACPVALLLTLPDQSFLQFVNFLVLEINGTEQINDIDRVVSKLEDFGFSNNKIIIGLGTYELETAKEVLIPEGNWVHYVKLHGLAGISLTVEDTKTKNLQEKSVKLTFDQNTSAIEKDAILLKIVPFSNHSKFLCSRSGYYQDKTNCRRFYFCSKYPHSDKFVVFHYQCPKNQAFHEEFQTCSLRARCDGADDMVIAVPQSKFSCPSPGYHRDPEHCKWFYYCSYFGGNELKAYEFRCPSSDLAFDDQNLLCNWKYLVAGCHQESQRKVTIETTRKNEADTARIQKLVRFNVTSNRRLLNRENNTVSSTRRKKQLVYGDGEKSFGKAIPELTCISGVSLTVNNSSSTPEMIRNFVLKKHKNRENEYFYKMPAKSGPMFVNSTYNEITSLKDKILNSSNEKLTYTYQLNDDTKKESTCNLSTVECNKKPTTEIPITFNSKPLINTTSRNVRNENSSIILAGNRRKSLTNSARNYNNPRHISHEDIRRTTIIFNPIVNITTPAYLNETVKSFQTVNQSTNKREYQESPKFATLGKNRTSKELLKVNVKSQWLVLQHEEPDSKPLESSTETADGKVIKSRKDTHFDLDTKNYRWNVPFASESKLHYPRYFECKTEGLFYHPKDCTKYYECFWDKWKQELTVHEFSCPVKLIFDKEIYACNNPSAKCR